MDRLTKINKDGTATIDFDMLGTPFGKDTVYDIIELYHLACKHLAAYEDIGTVEDFARLMQLKNDGRLVELPCWGNVYIISGGIAQEMQMCHYRGNGMGVYDMQCECIDQHEDCDVFCHNENDKACGYNFRIAEIGKTVFLTREEAEKKLEEGKV